VGPAGHWFHSTWGRWLHEVENKGEFPADVPAPDYALRNLTELPSLLGVE